MRLETEWNQSEFRIHDVSEGKQIMERRTGFHHDVSVCVQRETKSQQGVLLTSSRTQRNRSDTGTFVTEVTEVTRWFKAMHDFQKVKEPPEWLTGLITLWSDEAGPTDFRWWDCNYAADRSLSCTKSEDGNNVLIKKSVVRLLSEVCSFILWSHQNSYDVYLIYLPLTSIQPSPQSGPTARVGDVMTLPSFL